MVRKAFTMKVFSENVKEYIQRHNPIWKDLKDLLKSHGVHNYNIFLDRKTNILFGYVEVDSEEKWNAIAHTKICKKWWSYMTDLMETNPDNSPVSNELIEVFHID